MPLPAWARPPPLPGYVMMTAVSEGQGDERCLAATKKLVTTVTGVRTGVRLMNHAGSMPIPSR